MSKEETSVVSIIYYDVTRRSKLHYYDRTSAVTVTTIIAFDLNIVAMFTNVQFAVIVINAVKSE